jgi:hypothetical protein
VPGRRSLPSGRLATTGGRHGSAHCASHTGGVGAFLLAGCAGPGGGWALVVPAVAVGGDGGGGSLPAAQRVTAVGFGSEFLDPRVVVPDGVLGEVGGSLADDVGALVEGGAHVGGDWDAAFGDEAGDEPRRRGACRRARRRPFHGDDPPQRVSRVGRTCDEVRDFPEEPVGVGAGGFQAAEVGCCGGERGAAGDLVGDLCGEAAAGDLAGVSVLGGGVGDGFVFGGELPDAGPAVFLLGGGGVGDRPLPAGPPVVERRQRNAELLGQFADDHQRLQAAVPPGPGGCVGLHAAQVRAAARKGRKRPEPAGRRVRASRARGSSPEHPHRPAQGVGPPARAGLKMLATCWDRRFSAASAFTETGADQVFSGAA